jgi:2-polyprenyl-3-methyl-5-hydroxy-6-metoxy-1,4-benzoquinol methylase
MGMRSSLSILDLPFCIGACTGPHNPDPLPNIFPISLEVNHSLGRIEQSNSQSLEKLLNIAYSIGVEMGTPSVNSELGDPYVNDFMRFIESSMPQKGRVLEIGAGIGYLSKLLHDKGWFVESIEPGSGYRPYWEKYGLKVINDFFPSRDIDGQFDLIIFYTVLEHMKDTQAFLHNVSMHLAPQGKVILSVPDCASEIETGDPSMLLHEHFQYFTSRSLIRTLVDAGYEPVVTNSSFGRSLYACATLDNRVGTIGSVSAKDLLSVEKYLCTMPLLRDKFRCKVGSFLSKGSVGFYCPARALNFLPQDTELRFFDDAPELHGKYYPPFRSPIESRIELIHNPPKTLFIMSRTFGERLKSALRLQLPKTAILTINELAGSH